MIDLDQTTFHRMIKLRHLLTPIAIDWWQLKVPEGYERPQYKTLYLFGIRIATWRVDV